MTLTTHALAGAALAAFVPEHPVVGFCAGFASHLALDALPHWNYKVRSASLNPRIGGAIRFDHDLLVDAFAIGVDGIIGLLLSLLLFATPSNWIAILCGMAGGVFPDFLHFVYTRFPREPLKSFAQFHIRIQNEIFDGRMGLGILSQMVAAGAIVAAAKALLH
jgi:hypothetical protein